LSFLWKATQEKTAKKTNYCPELIDTDFEESEEEIISQDDQGKQEYPEIHNIPELPDDYHGVEVEEVAPQVPRWSQKWSKPKRCACEDDKCSDTSCLTCSAFAAASVFKCNEEEPSNWKEAKASLSKSNCKWKAAMDEELARLKELNTWWLNTRWYPDLRGRLLSDPLGNSKSRPTQMETLTNTKPD
jgi:hypothetical protein